MEGMANSYTFVRSTVLSIPNDPAFSSLKFHRPASCNRAPPLTHVDV